MKMRKTIKFKEHKDRFDGYENLGAAGGRSCKVATEAVAGLLRGVGRRWKNVRHRNSRANINLFG